MLILPSTSIQGSVAEKIDFAQFDLATMAPAIAAFLFVGVVDVSGVVFGLATLANIPSDAAGNVPGSLSAFLGCGVGTIVGSLTGLMADRPRKELRHLVLAVQAPRR